MWSQQEYMGGESNNKWKDIDESKGWGFAGKGIYNDEKQVNWQ